MASGYQEVNERWDILMLRNANEWLDAQAEERERHAAEQERKSGR